MENYTKHELRGKKVHKLLILFLTFLLLLDTTHINTCCVWLLLLTVPCTIKKTRTYHILLLFSIDGCANVGSSTASFKDLVIFYKRTLPMKQLIFCWRVSYRVLWIWQQLSRSNNSTNKAELSKGHSLCL